MCAGGCGYRALCNTALVFKKLTGYQGDRPGEMPRTLWPVCANCAPEAHGLASEGRAAVSQTLDPFAGRGQHSWTGGPEDGLRGRTVIQQRRIQSASRLFAKRQGKFQRRAMFECMV